MNRVPRYLKTHLLKCSKASRHIRYLKTRPPASCPAGIETVDEMLVKNIFRWFPGIVFIWKTLPLDKILNMLATTSFSKQFLDLPYVLFFVEGHWVALGLQKYLICRDIMVCCYSKKTRIHQFHGKSMNLDRLADLGVCGRVEVFCSFVACQGPYFLHRSDGVIDKSGVGKFAVLINTGRLSESSKDACFQLSFLICLFCRMQISLYGGSDRVLIRYTYRVVRIIFGWGRRGACIERTAA